jgi:hypothetical protein
MTLQALTLASHGMLTRLCAGVSRLSADHISHDFNCVTSVVRLRHVVAFNCAAQCVTYGACTQLPKCSRTPPPLPPGICLTLLKKSRTATARYTRDDLCIIPLSLQSFQTLKLTPLIFL